MVLGLNPDSWNRYEPLPASQAVLDGFTPFSEAVVAAANGDPGRAREFLERIDGARIQEWYIEHAQSSGTYRVALLGTALNGGRARNGVGIRYPRASDELAVFVRDGFRCRYCQRPIVRRQILKAFNAVVGNDAFPMGKTNTTTHGAALAYRAVVDHVDPFAAGGASDIQNLVTACYPCNFGKAHFTLEQLALERPRPPLLDGWNGLEAHLLGLKARAESSCAL